MSLLNDDDMIGIRGPGVRKDPTMDELIEYFDTAESSRLGIDWTNIQQLIDNTIKDVFETVQKNYRFEPPHPSKKSLHPNSGWSMDQINEAPSRAMFGIDIMLKETVIHERPVISPQVLEVQWAPDCSQALKMIPDFWDEILSAVFLDDFTNVKKL
jgi:hypothetical protein